MARPRQELCVRRKPWQNLAGNVGLGADLALGDAVGLRLMAKDYVGKFDFKDATTLDVQSQTAHNWALTAGLRFNF